MIGVKKAAGLGLALLTGLTLFAGCGETSLAIESTVGEITGGVEGLLAPPRLSEEQNAIYDALSSHLSGQSMRLVYPQEGENLSAFTLCELDGTEGGEAVVFYEPSSASAASPVKMAVLDQREEGWQVADDFTLEGSGVQDLSILTLIDGPAFGVSLDYAGDSGSNLLCLYGLEGEEVRQIGAFTFQEKSIGDFTGDGIDDLLLLYTADDPVGQSSAQAGLFRWQEEEGFVEINSCPVNPDMGRYERLLAADEDGQARFYLDGYRGNTMVTEVIRLTKDTLENETISLGEYPQRPGLLSMDVNGDGLVEIPSQEPLPGYTGEEDPLYLTRWYRLEEGEYHPVWSGYVNSQFSYQFIFPEEWEGKVTVQWNQTTNEAVFIQMEDGYPLFSLRAVPVSDWLAGKYPGYQQLLERGQTVFLMRMVTGTGDCALSAAEIRERFGDLSG